MECNLLHATPVLRQKCCMQHFFPGAPNSVAPCMASRNNFLISPVWNIPQRERLAKKMRSSSAALVFSGFRTVRFGWNVLRISVPD